MKKKEPASMEEGKEQLHKVSGKIKLMKRKFGVSKRSRDMTGLKIIVEKGDGKIHTKDVYVGDTYTKFGYYRKSNESIYFGLILNKAFLQGYLCAKRQEVKMKNDK